MYKRASHVVMRSGNAADFTAVNVRHFGANAAFASPAKSMIQTENTLTICANGRVVCSLSCSADHVDELAIGHLYTQGIVTSASALRTARVDIAFPTATVEITDARAVAPASAGKPALVTTSSARLYPARTASARPFADTRWTESSIYRIARIFAEDRTSHALTGGSHSAYLANEDGILCVREDIGRHNAFDKVVGWAIMNGVDLSTCILCTSGRVPTDIVHKAIRSRIPVLVSKSVTTDKAVQLARTANLVLICEARPESFTLVSGPDPTASGEEPLARAM